jgi:hypothetical protein
MISRTNHSNATFVERVLEGSKLNCLFDESSSVTSSHSDSLQRHQRGHLAARSFSQDALDISGSQYQLSETSSHHVSQQHSSSEQAVSHEGSSPRTPFSIQTGDSFQGNGVNNMNIDQLAGRSFPYCCISRYPHPWTIPTGQAWTDRTLRNTIPIRDSSIPTAAAELECPCSRFSDTVLDGRRGI